MKKQTVSIVIPNWNGVELLKKNLPWVLKCAPNSEILVVDDGSTDGSVQYLASLFPRITVIRSQNRRGFASTVNTGVERAHGDIIVLLNTDVRPEPNVLDPIGVHFTDPNTFAVGFLDKSEEHGVVVLRGRGEAHWERGYLVHSRGEARGNDTAWVSGGSGAFQKSIWMKLGGMDSLYNPFYWEDIDLSYRALKAGYRIAFEPRCVVNHFHEEGKIKTEFSQFQIQTVAYRNQYIFIWKNLSYLPYWLAHIIWTPILLLKALLRFDQALLYGFILALGNVTKIIAARKKIAPHRLFSDYEIYRKPGKP